MAKLSVCQPAKKHKQKQSLRDLVPALSLYLARRAEGTRKQYLAEWERFCKWAEEKRLDPSRLSDMTGLAYIEHCSHRAAQKLPGQKMRGTISKSSQKFIATELHSCCAYLAARKMLPCDPFDLAMDQLAGARPGDRRPTKAVPFAAVPKILELHPGPSKKAIMFRAAQAVLWGLGLRVGEACSIRVCDLKQTGEGTLYISLQATKAQKPQSAVGADWAMERLAEAQKMRRGEGAEEESPLLTQYFETSSARPLDRWTLRRWVKADFRALGLTGSAHSARATAITKLLADGTPYRQVQEFSRHASVAMVELYDKRRFTIEQNPGRKLKF